MQCLCSLYLLSYGYTINTTQMQTHTGGRNWGSKKGSFNKTELKCKNREEGGRKNALLMSHKDQKQSSNIRLKQSVTQAKYKSNEKQETKNKNIPAGRLWRRHDGGRQCSKQADTAENVTTQINTERTDKDERKNKE